MTPQKIKKSWILKNGDLVFKNFALLIRGPVIWAPVLPKCHRWVLEKDFDPVLWHQLLNRLAYAKKEFHTTVINMQ